jgi:hypothetical protein
MKTAGSLH